MADLKVFDVLNQMVIRIGEAKKVPFSNKVMVDPEQLSEYVRLMQASVESDIVLARDLLAEQDRILTNAKAIEADAADKAEKKIAEANATADAIVNQANVTAGQTVDDANSQATSILADANARAADAVRLATDQATTTVAQAQQQASSMIAEATARAQQMVDEDEITKRAQAAADELMQKTQQECLNYKNSINAALKEMMAKAETVMDEQLAKLRETKDNIPG